MMAQAMPLVATVPGIAPERFALRPRAVARVRALRDSLLRRGWRELPASPAAGVPAGTLDLL